MGIVRHNGCHIPSTDAERKTFPSPFQPFKMASPNCTCNYRFQLSALMVSPPCVGAGVGMATTRKSRAEHRDPYIPCQPSLGRSVRHRDGRKPEPAENRSLIIEMNHRLLSRLSLRPESMKEGKNFSHGVCVFCAEASFALIYITAACIRKPAAAQCCRAHVMCSCAEAKTDGKFTARRMWFAETTRCACDGAMGGLPSRCRKS